jgi:hypothetical protein
MRKEAHRQGDEDRNQASKPNLSCNICCASPSGAENTVELQDSEVQVRRPLDLKRYLDTCCRGQLYEQLRAPDDDPWRVEAWAICRVLRDAMLRQSVETPLCSRVPLRG